MAVVNVKLPFALTDRLLPPLFCNTTPVPERPAASLGVAERRAELAELRRRVAGLKARLAATSRREADLKAQIETADLDLQIQTAERRVLDLKRADTEREAARPSATRRRRRSEG